jgi:hypothetical protein
MSIPAPTTKVTIARKAINYEKYYESDQDYEIVLSGVPAHIYSVSITNSHDQPGTTTTKSARLVADPCGLMVDDWVTDESTGETYEVTSCENITSFIPQTTAQLQHVSRR